MRLKQLQLYGFKSFAKNTMLEFPHDISAIVGPNGSGKSNVTEAVAWVLGEQSIKTLRGKKGEDLIFNGSDVAPRMSKASASLIFSTDEGEESVIKRVVYRDSTNEYFLNGNHCRLKDIVEFLSGMGLGTSRHHIISQGEADRMLSASPKERKAIMEDALGLKIYQIKKDAGLRKLVRTEENITQVDSLRREIHPHLRFLKKQVSKVEKARELQEKLESLYSLYLAKSKALILKKKKLIEEKKKEPREKMLKYEKKITETKEFLSSLKHEDGLPVGEAGKIREEVNSLEREIGRQEGMLSQARLDLSRSEARRVEEEKPLSEKRINIAPEKAREFSDFLKREIERILEESDVNKIRFALTSLKEKVSIFFVGVISNVGSVKEELSPSPDNEFRGNIIKLENKYKELIEKLEILKEKEGKIIKGNEQALELERDLHNTEMRLSEIKSEINSFEVDEERIKLKEEDLKEEKAEAQAILKKEIVFDFVDDEGSVEIDAMGIEEEKREIERTKIKLEESGSVGEDIIREHDEVKTRDEFLGRELSDLGDAADSLRELISKLEESLASDFKAGIDKVDKEFQNFFELMFGGGRASLKVMTPSPKKKKEQGEELLSEGIGEEAENEGMPVKATVETETEAGIEISVSLPKKRIKGLNMLSGGERALTSIALLFAMSQVNPPPFLILDETDAALDESNSRKYAEMLKDLSKKTQLILVTHNRETMKSAGVLYGVTMGADSMSHLLSVKFDKAEEFAGN